MAFEKMHPFSVLAYFAAVIIFAMLIKEPTAVFITFIFSVGMCAVFCGFSETAKGFGYTLALMVLMTASNILFVHKGQTVLFFINGNPATAEAVFSGAVSALTVASVIYLCKCYSELVTDDKFMYIFGKKFPKLALLLSMTLSAIPRIKRKYTEMEQAQRALGAYGSSSFTDKLKVKLKGVSVLISVSLEGSVVTSDSMTARGYGLKGRRDSSVYRLRAFDIFFLSASVLFSVLFIFLGMKSVFSYDFYRPNESISALIRTLAYSAQISLYMLALIAELYWRLKWHYLRSRI